MSTQSYSSISTSKRRGALRDDIDRSVYTVGQTLASIVNDPRTAHQTGGGFWGLGHDASQTAQPPPLDPAKYPPVTKADVQKYIDLVHGAYDRFTRDRQSLEAFDAQHQAGSSDARAASSTQGEPFMAAVQAVPMQFFQEGFFDGWDDFFKQYCKEQSADELYEQIDQLNRYLDVVELQLLREVASRSDSFFQAAASLQHLLGLLGDSVGSIRALRRGLAAADEQMYSTAVSVKALQARRSNLQATLDITKGLEEVVAAQAALDCMLESQDYAGALELLDQMKQLLEQPGLRGLQCVRHLPPRLVDTTAAVERALGNEFLNTVANTDVARVVAEAAADAEAQPDASISLDGSLAPGSALWHLPTAAERSSSSSITATEQLQEKLLPLAVGLYRSDRLASTLQQYKANVGDEVKCAVRDAVQQVLPVLLVASGDMPPGQTHAGQAGPETQLADQLQLLHHGAFMVLLHAAARVIYSCVDHVVCVGQLLEAVLAGINAPASQLASLRKECVGALQVVVDVGLGRWVKLLAARAGAHTRLKQYELRQLLDLSEQVAAYAESLGARTLGSFRAALQSQCKALLDHSHARCMNQLQHLLESEQWVAVEVPWGFQAIVDRLVNRCGEGAALLAARGPQAPPAPAAAAGPPRGAGSASSSSSSNGPGPAAAAGSGAGGSGAAVAADGISSEQHSPTLQLSGKSFHLVNSALMLLKMVDEYMSLYDLMPQFGAEIVHRELELLKLFNSQTCALVLGAGAMRTAGLRSISAKQLALSCQAVAMLATLLPLLRAGSLALVSQPRRALLMPEFDRLLQDLTMHMDEVHSKLVDIMRDRLSAATQALPAEVKAVSNNNNNMGDQAAPSHTISLLAKQLGTLRTVLVPFLLREEVEFIFGAVARAYSDALSETFEVLLAQDSSCEGVVRVNALTMLQAFRDLPLDPARASNYCSRLSTTYTKHFGLPPWDQEKLGQNAQQQQQQQQQQLPQKQQQEIQQQLPQEQEQQQQQQEQQQQEKQEQQQQPPQQLPDGGQQQQQHPHEEAAAEAAAAAAQLFEGAEQHQQPQQPQPPDLPVLQRQGEDCSLDDEHQLAVHAAGQLKQPEQPQEQQEVLEQQQPQEQQQNVQQDMLTSPEVSSSVEADDSVYKQKQQQQKQEQQVQREEEQQPHHHAAESAMLSSEQHTEQPSNPEAASAAAGDATAGSDGDGAAAHSQQLQPDTELLVVASSSSVQLERHPSLDSCSSSVPGKQAAFPAADASAGDAAADASVDAAVGWTHAAGLEHAAAPAAASAHHSGMNGIAAHESSSSSPSSGQHGLSAAAAAGQLVDVIAAAAAAAAAAGEGGPSVSEGAAPLAGAKPAAAAADDALNGLPAAAASSDAEPPAPQREEGPAAVPAADLLAEPAVAGLADVDLLGGWGDGWGNDEVLAPNAAGAHSDDGSSGDAAGAAQPASEFREASSSRDAAAWQQQQQQHQPSDLGSSAADGASGLLNMLCEGDQPVQQGSSQHSSVKDPVVQPALDQQF